MATVQITSQNFADTLKKGGIVLLDWWAPWCGPCRAFGPIFERVAATNPDIVFGKVNSDEEQALARQYNINSIPTLMIIRDSTLLFEQAGMLPEKTLADLIAQARQVDMEKVKRETAKEQPTAQAAFG